MVRFSFHNLREESQPHLLCHPDVKFIHSFSATRLEAFVNQTDFLPLRHVIKLFLLLAFTLSQLSHLSLPPLVLLDVVTENYISYNAVEV